MQGRAAHSPSGGITEDVHWTKAYVKVCADGRAELEDWALNTVGGEVTLCSSCFGQ